jgi:alpha-D-xyloside xylohydrolase
MNDNCLFTRRLMAAAFLAFATAGQTQPALTKNSQIEELAPGLWRIRLGTPEKLTPTFFRSAPVAENALKALSAGEKPPFSFSSVRFSVNERGCALQLPLGQDEQVFGLGLNTRLFNLTNRRLWIRTSDDPESELNDSHAPVPFYVTTAGYGVLWTARVTSPFTPALPSRLASRQARTARGPPLPARRNSIGSAS